MTLDRSVNHLKDPKQRKNQLCAGGIQPFMKPDYKVILSTVLKLDKARWDLGDALVAECGAPDPTSAGYDGPGKLRAAWHYMRENGYDCTLEDLSELRRVAYVFRQSTRTVGYFVGPTRRVWYA